MVQEFHENLISSIMRENYENHKSKNGSKWSQGGNRPCRFAAGKKTNLVQSSECMSIVDADMRFPLWLPELRSPLFPGLSAVI